MATITKPITDLERAERAKHIDESIASVRLEGLEPSAEAKAIFDRYVSGELSMDEMSAEIDSLLNREYGPIHLPRD